MNVVHAPLDGLSVPYLNNLLPLCPSHAFLHKPRSTGNLLETRGSSWLEPIALLCFCPSAGSPKILKLIRLANAMLFTCNEVNLSGRPMPFLGLHRRRFNWMGYRQGVGSPAVRTFHNRLYTRKEANLIPESGPRHNHQEAGMTERYCK